MDRNSVRSRASLYDSHVSSVRESGSKAISEAMKALQEKIKWLEDHNFRLATELDSLRSHFQTDQLDLQTKNQEIARFEQEMLHKDQEIHYLSRQIQQLQQTLTSQKSENDRVAHNLQERIATLERQLAQNDQETSLLQRNLSKTESEKTQFQANLRELEVTMKRQRDEIEANKQAFLLSKNSLSQEIRESQTANSAKNAEFEAVLKDSNVQNQHLRELLQAKDLQIANLQEEIAILKRAHYLSESARIILAEESEKARKLVYDLSISHEKLRESVQSPSKTSQKQVKFTENAEMKRLEKEIKRLNREYQLVLKTAESMDVRDMRGKLDEIAQESERKGQKLAELRRKAVLLSSSEVV